MISRRERVTYAVAVRPASDQGWRRQVLLGMLLAGHFLSASFDGNSTTLPSLSPIVTQTVH
jgi:hypothetical protein